MPPQPHPGMSAPSRRRRKPKAPSARQVQQQTAQAQPLSSKPVRPKRVETARRTQRQTQRAMPLDSTPGRPPVIQRPPAEKVQAKVRAGSPIGLCMR